MNDDNNEDYVPRHAKGEYKKKRVNDYNDEMSFDIKNKKNLYEKDRKFSIGYIFIFIFLVIIGYSLYHVVLWGFDNKKTSDITKKINDDVEVVEVKDDDNTHIVSSEDDSDNLYWYFVKFPLIDVDLSKLKKDNSDTVGWININNTNINYPFVQTKDNDYYLEHSFDKKYNEAGWLFLDYRNKQDFSDKNNIIYGHSRLDKTMFGSLNKVLKKDWYSNHDNHVIRISLDNENTLWQVFSVYKIKTESYYITTSFNSDDDYLRFLDTISKRSIYDFDVHLDWNDKVLTLSTCYSDTERTVVHARLIKRSSK